MLRQDINLYTSLKKPEIKSEFISWQQYLLILLGLLIIFCLMVIYAFWNLHLLNQKGQQLDHEINALQNRFFSLKKQFPAFFFSTEVKTSITQLQQELAFQQHLLRTITQRTSYAKILEGLSTAIIPQVWLQDITINKSGTEIILKGRSLTADKVHQFTANIQHNPTFISYTSNLKEIGHTTENQTVPSLSFQINLTKKLT